MRAVASIVGMGHMDIPGMVERVGSGETRALSRRQLSILARTVRVASTSTENHRHGAVLARHGSVVSVGVNATKTSPDTFGMEDSVDAFAVHAEEAAIRAFPGKDLRGFTLYVARIHTPKIGRKHHMFTSDSRPCPRCMKAIRESGIGTIVYTVGDAASIARGIEIAVFG